MQQCAHRHHVTNQVFGTRNVNSDRPNSPELEKLNAQIEWISENQGALDLLENHWKGKSEIWKFAPRAGPLKRTLW
jgi:hypothetical protein